MLPKVPIACLCGSTHFKKEFLQLAQTLEFEGYIVVMPNVFSKADSIELTKNQLKLLTFIHDQKIEMCDVVYVVDAPGKNGKPYIGISTKNELKKAKQLGKPIRYLSSKNSKLIGDAVPHKIIDNHYRKTSVPLVQPSRTEAAIKYRVDDLPGALIPGSRMTKILQQLEVSKPISERTLEFLDCKGFHALHLYAKKEISFGEYLKVAEVEKIVRCSSAEAKAIKAEAERKCKAEAIQERFRLERKQAEARAIEVEAERKRKTEAIQKRLIIERKQAEEKQRAFDNDPKNIAKVKESKLRERYDLTFSIDKPDFPKLMNILHQVDSSKRLSGEEVVWLSTEGNRYYTTKLQEAFHRNEAEFYVSEFKKNKDPWSAVNASSQYRKCKKSNTADAMLSSISVSRLKKLKLKSALYTTHGGVKRDLRKWDEALALAEQARILTPQNFRPYTLLGAVNMEIGQYDLGQSWYKKAVERGYSEKSMDSELRAIFKRADKSKQAALRDHLLKIDPIRYSWVNKKSASWKN